MADDTKYEICSRACVLVGGKPIGSFDDGTTESMVAGKLYDPRTRELLVEHDWRFATATIELFQLVPPPPTSAWSSAWQLPPDYLKLLRLVTQGSNITSFEINQDTVCCDFDNSNRLFLDYIRQVDANRFPPYFTVVLEERLSADFAGVLREDAALASFHRTMANQKLLTAKRLDRLNEPARKIPVGRLKLARR